MKLLDLSVGFSRRYAEQVRKAEEDRIKGTEEAFRVSNLIAEHFRPGDWFTFMGKCMTVRRVSRQPQVSRLEMWLGPPTVQAIYENNVGELCEFTLTSEEALRLIEQSGTSLAASRKTPEGGV